MTRRTGPDQATAQLVTARMGGWCLRCNQRPGSQIHHRLPRKSGGRGNNATVDVNEAARLVWVCQPATNTSNRQERGRARAEGWLAEPRTKTPRQHRWSLPAAPC